jgi:lipopolysaccharide transport system permease protein
MRGLAPFVVSPFGELASLLTTHRQLTREVARRELTERYAATWFGAFWVLFHPLFLIALYLFIFTVVFDLRTGAIAGRDGRYAVYLLAGLIPWMGFQEAMARACVALIGNASLVRQVVFPIEVLPLKTCVPAIVNQGIATFLFLGFMLGGGHGLPSTAALLPLLWCLQVLGMLGFSYALAIMTVFMRDTKDLVQLFATAGIYLVPVFYLPSWLPRLVYPLLIANPFSHMVWCYQDALYNGAIAHPASWIVFPVFCILSFILGLNLFRKLKPLCGNLL